MTNNTHVNLKLIYGKAEGILSPLGSVVVLEHNEVKIYSAIVKAVTISWSNVELNWPTLSINKFCEACKTFKTLRLLGLGLLG
jgi:hypothetical protein